MRPTSPPRFAANAGYSLVELIVAMGLLTVVMGATLGGLANVMKGNEIVMAVASLNNSVRIGLDLMVRDMLQVGSGLPASHTVTIPNGDNAVPVRIPGPPGSTFLSAVGDTVLPAVIPLANQGPMVDGTQTDAVTILMADNAFLDVALSAVTATSVVVAAVDANGNPGPNLGAGPDRVTEGQLMLIIKGSVNTLVQVTSVDVPARRLTFADGDSLRLNQSTAESGNLAAVNAEAPVNSAAATRISRVRMISYYLDTVTDAEHPRLVRRINNGHPTSFSNALGTAVASDVVNMQLTYDISNGAGNPGGVAMTAVDLTTVGACAPTACGRTQIRKVNILLTSRSPEQISARNAFLSNTLESQVSLRAMAFVDRYR